MPEAATTNSPVDETVLDELVPPPGPRWRRAVLWVAFVGAFGALMWGTTTGTLVPKVSTTVQTWGGDGPVRITFDVRNMSRVDVLLTDGPRPRAGLTSLGYTTGFRSDDRDASASAIDPFPIRLGPDESIDLTIWYRVTDCQKIRSIDPEDDAIDLQVRIADGPASWITTERTVDAERLASDENEPRSWPAAMAQFACPT